MQLSGTPQTSTLSWEMLEKSLAHPNALIREKAIESAGRFGDARSLVALQSAVRDENSRIRAAAAQAFVHAFGRNEPEVNNALAQIIAAGSDTELRRFLISQSASTTSPALQRVVIERLVDPFPALRHAAQEVLQEQPAWLSSNAAVEALSALEAATRYTQPEVAAMAVTWSEKVRHAKVRRTMLESGVASMLTLTSALRSGSALMRAAAAVALGGSTDGRALPALVDALRDADENVRRAAAVSLGRLGWGASTEEELASQLVALGRWAEAVQLGPCAVDALLHAASRSRPATQVAAIEALAETRSVRAILPMQELLKFPEPSVRRAAARALKLLEWVPTTDAQAISHAIELEDWSGAASFGAAAIAPLVTELKASVGHGSRIEAIRAALAGLRDAAAAPELLRLCRDGEVAATAVRALESLLENVGPEIPEEVLAEMAGLNNIVQFQLEMDARYAKPVRTGIDFVSVEALQIKAASARERRAAHPERAEAA